MGRRVVVTGLGIVSPIGNNVPEFWNSLENGISGIDWVKAFDASEYHSKVAGEVKNFDPTQYMDRKEARRTSRFIQLAVASATQAIEDSGLNPDEIPPYRSGVVYGVGMGALDLIEEQHKVLLNKGPRRVSPFFIPMTISNMASGTLAIKFGFKGVNITVTTACASSTNAIGEAYRMIRDGILDVALTGGAESTITPLAFAGFGSMTALSTKPPDEACRPFDANRDGFIIAEGSATLVLEEYEHAKKRGAKIYAEIAGYGATDDANHMTAPDLEGTSAAMAMRLALESAKVNPEEVDYINAHGTSTPLNDKTETRAIKKVFGERKDLNISSTKSMHGHALGAAGALEAVATVLAIINETVPPTINLKTPDPECDLNYTPNTAVRKKIRCALSNSFGFGGHNASVLFKRI
ncbi:beta-ketoacyl-ACP synthase II [Kosmotoga sp.]|uniref:beta-ketoacyl-ACP synthase II n=1 Tax=Kosmotoga sp. TaxID=1955248 RepID=UPI0024AA3D51|nr:beta-ketoacyl-ACP synthase II [Kosmotoga sp.]MDI3523875.1 3-oxoacyl-[acyl-carrier-protein] synthase [Kosmotoga sp.]MDK2953659.1 3-oxoacyl-[acyl-carrier-protein] synthase [Kosmotoga sp.]